MKHNHHGSEHHHHHHHHSSRNKHAPEPKLQIICLASGGGPAEDNVTGFLVRSLSTNWAKNSVLAVDAGSHLSSIVRLLANDFPLVAETRPSLEQAPSLRRNGSVDTDVSSMPGDGDDDDDDSSEFNSVAPTPKRVLEAGPFAGLPFPHESARANALHVVRECVSTYLITHPHLDHLAGFVINTAAFHNTSRPKRLAAMPSTVNAIKTHIFNDIIWPNLSDEDGGVGFVTFQRLAQGGNIAVGEGQGKGYIEVCDGLCVRGMKVSHGHCTRPHGDTHRNSEVGLSEPVHHHKSSRGDHASVHVHGHESPQLHPHSIGRRTSSVTQLSAPGTPGLGSLGGHSGHAGHGLGLTTAGVHPATAGDPVSREVVVDSTAYFIRCDHTGRECLIFGDVEPDSISLNPRNIHIWAEAAPKIASGTLRAVFIECSYDDSQGDSILFGHLAPRHIVKELNVLAHMVKQRRLEDRERKEHRKRKRTQTWPAGMQPPGGEEWAESAPPTDDEGPDHGHHLKRRATLFPGSSAARAAQRAATSAGDAAWALEPTSPLSSRRRESVANAGEAFFKHHHHLGKNALAPAPTFTFGETSQPQENGGLGALAGLRVIIFHVKDTMMDGPLVGDRILAQLEEHEGLLKEIDGVGLGCEFVICKVGDSFMV